MDLNKFEEYKKRVDKKLNEIDAKISYLNEGVQGLSVAFKEFREEMTDYMSFAADSFSDHENRLREIEKKLDWLYTSPDAIKIFFSRFLKKRQKSLL